MTRGYAKNAEGIVWVDFINGKTGESFHKQKICIEGAGWTIDSESIAEFKIADPPNPFTKFYANRLDVSKGNKKQIVIYWFMFKKFGAKDTVSMIRISVPADNNETTDILFNRAKDFIEDQLFDAMYKKGEIEIITNAEDIYKENGDKGLLVMIMAALIPIGITLIGVTRKD